jgi:hypothetical protein
MAALGIPVAVDVQQRVAVDVQQSARGSRPKGRGVRHFVSAGGA